MQPRLLGSLTPRIFLRRHWQKRPLFVPRAAPQLTIVDQKDLARLAARDDVESRIVERSGKRWKTRHGPFRGAIKPRMRNWTLLVNGVNLHVRAADELLRSFDFVPQARLDDVMVSYATPGGGVGPHTDSYDVFLLQGPGRRAWRVRGKRYLANPGDLLYLPPGVEHDGVALEPCFTYSIGFRAPRGAELAAAFLDFLHRRGLPDATYRDPGLAPAANPAAIPWALLDFAQRVLARIRWSQDDVALFLGEFLTEPKAHVLFKPARASRLARDWGVRLDPKTQFLYRGSRFFVNGESFSASSRSRTLLRELADRRRLPAARLAPLAPLIRQWHRLGYVHWEKP